MSRTAPPPSKGAPSDKVPVSAFATVWLTLFLDLMAFGIVIPVLPFYAEHFGASPTLVALLSTSFSLAQFVMAPILGRISDRVGRRPVMLISIAGSAVSLTVLGFAGTLWMVFLARVITGICNSNVSTANAYVADRVRPQDRAKYMGMMGSAIGLGFVFGPAIGGLLAVDGHPERPFLYAAGLTVINWLMAYKFLPESRPPKSTIDAPKPPVFSRITAVFRPDVWRGPLGGLIMVNLLFFSAFAAMESTFALLMNRKFGWGARETGAMFALIGVVIVLTQGVLVGRLVARLGEIRTLVTGAIVLVGGLSMTGLGSTAVAVVVGGACIALGNGLVSPSVNASVSRISSASDQGLNLGVSASAASLGRILGPVAAGPLFEWGGFGVGPGLPLVVAASLMALAAIIAGTFVRIPSDDNEVAPAPVEPPTPPA